MLRPNNRPLLAYFDSIKNLRLRQLTLILKAGYDPNLMVNARGQNGLQYMINYFGATDAHFRLQSPINKAAYLSCAKLLLDSGLDPNIADLLSGETAIFDAIRFNDKDMVALLLNYVDFSLRNKNGETALMCAAKFGSKQVMRMILDHLHHLELDDYFLRQRNRLGLTALELARVENLDCAKVITKHLISFGHHPQAVLSRSSSHHQLLAAAHHRNLPYHMRAAHRNQAAAAALLATDDSEISDYDVAGTDQLLATAPYQVGVVPQVRGRSNRSHYKGVTPVAAYYDPKAAEFNQYLLEQQEFGNGREVNELLGSGVASSSVINRGDVASGGSDDDNDYFGLGGRGAAGNGALTRSRSCMLGPNAGSNAGGSGAAGSSKHQPSKFSGAGSSGTAKKGVGSSSGAGKMASSSWESGGRNTIA